MRDETHRHKVLEDEGLVWGRFGVAVLKGKAEELLGTGLSRAAAAEGGRERGSVVQPRNP